MFSQTEGKPLTDPSKHGLRQRSAWRSVWSSLTTAKVPLAGLIVLLVIVFVSVATSILAPYGPNEGDITVRLKPPFWMTEAVPGHPLGTDEIGRDILTRLMYGGRVSLGVGLATTTLTTLIGVTLGLLSGFYGKVLDEVIMRLGDILLSFPFILLCMVAVLMLGPGLINIILVLGFFGWVGFARVVRAETLSLREKEFVEAAKVTGCSNIQILYKHILPNLIPSIIVVATFVMAAVIIAEATLSFLGLGIPPAVPSWGGMLNIGRNYMRGAPWLAMFPGFLLLLLVLSLNLLGDWLRDYLDPRLRF